MHFERPHSGHHDAHINNTQAQIMNCGHGARHTAATDDENKTPKPKIYFADGSATVPARLAAQTRHAPRHAHDTIPAQIRRPPALTQCCIKLARLWRKIGFFQKVRSFLLEQVCMRVRRWRAAVLASLPDTYMISLILRSAAHTWRCSRNECRGRVCVAEQSTTVPGPVRTPRARAARGLRQHPVTLQPPPALAAPRHRHAARLSGRQRGRGL